MRSLTFEDAVQQTTEDVLRVLLDKGLFPDDNGGLVRAIARSQLSRAQRFAGRRLRPVEVELDGFAAFEDTEEDAPQRVLAVDPSADIERGLAARQAEARWRRETGAAPLSGRSSRQAESQAVLRAAEWLRQNRRPFD